MKIITLIAKKNWNQEQCESELQQLLKMNNIDKSAVVNKNRGRKLHFHILIEDNKEIDLSKWSGLVKCCNQTERERFL